MYIESKYVFLFVEINGSKTPRVLTQYHRRVNVTPASYSGGLTFKSLAWLTIFVNCLDASGKLMSYRLKLHNNRTFLQHFQFQFIFISCYVISPNGCDVK